MLRFLWVTDVNADPPSIIVLRFTRVVFGVSCSPFLLNATIEHHLNLHKDSNPQLVKKLAESFYVDDVVTGAENEETAFTLYSQVKALLKEDSTSINLSVIVTVYESELS